MTSYGTATQTCSVCGAAVECTVLMSTNAFGSPDLDLRPPEMERSTISELLHECPQCGYINGNLSNTIEGAKETIESDRYQAIAADAELPEVASRFARFSLLHGADPEAAALALLRAAWVCDDADSTKQAKSFRNQAADILLTLQPFSDSEEQTTIATVLVDILRRAERFEEARSLAASLQEFDGLAANDIVQSVLTYQIRLCDEHDTDCHTVADCEQADCEQAD